MSAPSQKSPSFDRSGTPLTDKTRVEIRRICGALLEDEISAAMARTEKAHRIEFLTIYIRDEFRRQGDSISKGNRPFVCVDRPIEAFLHGYFDLVALAMAIDAAEQPPSTQPR